MPQNSVITFFLLSILISGCASQPVTIETAKPIEANKQVKFSQKTKVRNALLSFVRNNGFIGSVCALKVMINGERIGEVGTGKIINIYLKPGKHKVKIAPTNITLCGGNEIDTVVRLRRNSEKHFRVAVKQNFDMQPIKRSTADRDL